MGEQSSIVLNLERSADRWPDRIAIQEREGGTTFAALWQRACAVASYLSSEDLKPGDRVALILNNSADFVAIYYGVLAAGGIAVSLNAAAKARDFAIWLEHSGATWLFAEAANVEVEAACAQLNPAPRRVAVGASGGVLSKPWLESRSAGRAIRLESGQAAAMLYTSGTTGQPKGVLLSHRNLAANTNSIIQYLGLTQTDSIVSVLPFYYSYGNSVLHTHIAAGGQLILEANLVYPHKVVESLVAHRASGFAGVPSTFSLLLSRVKFDDYDLSALRYVTQAGGAMSPATIEKLRGVLPAARVFIMYGQTEATARISWLPPERLLEKLGSVGVPIPGIEISVRREDGTPAVQDEPGEVWVRGPNVMLGYWRNPEATAGVLRGEWLRTGDMGRLDAQGFLFLAGRRSDMIKTGAHRVHPQDVEDVIAEIAGVAEVAVTAVEDEVLGEAIKAVVVAAPGTSLDAMRVKAYCRQRLANYKVPKLVEFRAALPRTASGKVRRGELKEGNVRHE